MERVAVLIKRSDVVAPKEPSKIVSQAPVQPQANSTGKFGLSMIQQSGLAGALLLMVGIFWLWRRNRRRAEPTFRDNSFVGLEGAR